jgi:hypothetical protein
VATLLERCVEKLGMMKLKPREELKCKHRKTEKKQKQKNKRQEVNQSDTKQTKEKNDRESLLLISI